MAAAAAAGRRGHLPGPRLPARRGGGGGACVPFGGVAGLGGVPLPQGGGGADALPVQFTSPAFAAALGLERLLSGPAPKRTQVAIAPAGGPGPGTRDGDIGERGR